MTWFRLDDGFYDHPKVATLDPAAVGVWVLAATWSARHLTDGVIPKPILAKLTGSTPKAAAARAGQLVAAGLWHDDGDTWRFHDWADYQPTRSKVEQQRQDRNDRVARYRDKKRSGNALQQRDGNALQARDGDATVTPPPARPDPP